MLQTQSRDAESELLRFMMTTRTNLTDHQVSEVRTAPAPSYSTDWNRRHSKDYHLLLLSLSEHFKTMTVDSTDLPSTWQTLVKHFEGKAAADILAAEARFPPPMSY